MKPSSNFVLTFHQPSSQPRLSRSNYPAAGATPAAGEESIPGRDATPGQKAASSGKKLPPNALFEPPQTKRGASLASGGPSLLIGGAPPEAKLSPPTVGGASLFVGGASPTTKLPPPIVGGAPPAVGGDPFAA